jgi:hypothetical protein
LRKNYGASKQASKQNYGVYSLSQRIFFVVTLESAVKPLNPLMLGSSGFFIA